MEAKVKLGIKETKELLALIIAAANAVPQVLEDKKIKLDDVGTLLKLVPKIGPAVEGLGGSQGVIAEFEDLDDAEAAELIGYVAGELVLTDAKAKIYVTGGLKVLKKAFETYQEVAQMLAQVKALEVVAAAPAPQAAADSVAQAVTSDAAQAEVEAKK